MNLNYLEFEQPIAELEQKIEELRFATSGSGVNLTEEIERLQRVVARELGYELVDHRLELYGRRIKSE